MAAAKKKRKFKRLKKVHIWPSILFLVISVIISSVACMIFLLITLADLTIERFNSVCLNATYISRPFESADGTEKGLLDKMQGEQDYPEAIFVLDAEGEVIAGYGEQTYDSMAFLEEFGELYVDKQYMICRDTEDEFNLIDANGSINLTLVLKPENFKVFWEDGVELSDRLFEARYWLKTEMSDGRVVMVKCSAPLYLRDFIKAVGMGAIALGLMFLPILFFFINLIIGVVNQRRMIKQFYTDTTTGGWNYMYYENNAGKALNARFNSGKKYAVVDVTVMKYRNFCNYHGVREGENLLENIDRQLKTCIGRGEISAHAGKSSFVLFIKCTDRTQCENRVNALVNELTAKFGHGGVVLHAGIYFCEQEKNEERRRNAVRFSDPADCFNRAGAARAVITDDNVPACATYDDKLLEEQRWEHRVEEKMQSALDNEEFHVYIQPKYDPVTEKLAGAEALVRWISAEDGFVPPGRFIPIFEKNGFITKLDDYMITHVAKLQADWLAQNKEVVPVSVNVSRMHFSNPRLAEHICGLVDRYGVPHNLIEIELTESAFFDDKSTLLKTVHELNDMGFEISMDDFGAGYSSLNSLKDLPLDVLKLDAEFFRGENEENRGDIVVSEAITLAKKLNMRIVAEGVEKKEQVDFLAQHGCDMIQGYYYAKPMPADEYAQRL